MRVYLTGMNTFSANENMSTFSQASQVGTNSLRRPWSLSWSLTNSYLFMIWLKGFQHCSLPQGQFNLNLYVPLSSIEIWKFINLIHFRKYIDKMYAEFKMYFLWYKHIHSICVCGQNLLRTVFEFYRDNTYVNKVSDFMDPF